MLRAENNSGRKFPDQTSGGGRGGVWDQLRTWNANNLFESGKVYNIVLGMNSLIFLASVIRDGKQLCCLTITDTVQQTINKQIKSAHKALNKNNVDERWYVIQEVLSKAIEYQLI